MPNEDRPAAFRYGLAFLAIALALLLRFILWPLLSSDVPFLLLWPAVMVCAWYGGVGPGLLATLLSALAGWYFLLEPQYSFAVANPADVTAMILYLLLGASLSTLIEAIHRAKRRVEQHAFDLHNQREWFRVTLASIGDAVIATDPDGRVAFMNEIAQRLTGWTAEEGNGQPLEQVLRIVNEETRDPADNPVHKVLETGGIVGLANHTVLLRQDGAEVPIDDSAAPIRSAQGSLQGVVLVFRDVTERRRLESDQQRRAQELVEADHRKDEFLAALAHEIRNPLSAVQNAVQLMRHFGSPEPHVLEAGEVIDRQSHQALRLAEDLLDISRVGQGKVRLQKQPLELGAIIKQAVEVSRLLIDARQHELRINLPDEPIQLEADPVRLTQVIVNLLNNAAKYTNQGGRIALTAEQHEGFAIVRVRDSGIGITKEMLPRVFELFAQSERALALSRSGLGIGLKLVHTFVEMHEGSVEVLSEGVGQGSEFVVRLPLAANGGGRAQGPSQIETGS